MKEQTLQRLAKKLWAERLMLPEKKIGKYAIKHVQVKAGDKLMLVSMREAIFSGLPKCDFVVPEDTHYHQLIGPEGVWMSDLPVELVQMQRELASHVRQGQNVLIGGLGLGLVANMVSEKAGRVVVIERQREVIELVSPYLAKNVEVVQGDIMQAAKHVGTNGLGDFDVALLDTWQGTGEWVWQTEVVPLRRAIGSSIKRVYCWAEQVMLGQVSQGLFCAVSMPLHMLKSPYRCHMYAFAKYVQSQTTIPMIDMSEANGPGPEHFKQLLDIEQENRANPVIYMLARAFLTRVGEPWWEETFGVAWDEAVASEQQKKVS